jgi:hypothetical protein
MDLNKIAKDFLLAYFSDGSIKQPEHFDRDILGADPWDEAHKILLGEKPAWNKTIFADALGELIEEGKIKVWAEDTGWYYQINNIIDITPRKPPIVLEDIIQKHFTEGLE